jgi:hypothetical protein
MPLVKPEMPVAPDVPDIPAPPDNILREKMLRYSLGGSDNPIDGAWQYAQGLLDYLSPLFQWVALALLLWLGYRYLTQRNRPPAASAVPPSAPAQAPPPAPNHGDIIKPESHKEE